MSARTRYAHSPHRQEVPTMRRRQIEGDVPASITNTWPIHGGDVTTWASQGQAWLVVADTTRAERAETVSVLDPLVALHIAGRLAVNAVLAATVHRLRPTWEPAVRLGSRGRRGSCAPAR